MENIKITAEWSLFLLWFLQYGALIVILLILEYNLFYKKIKRELKDIKTLIRSKEETSKEEHMK